MLSKKMSQNKEITEKAEVQKLPRGGYLVDTPIGYIQFGSPPETIKDTMRMPKGVPQIFVLPRNFFSWVKGISVAELEFPLYNNFFIQKKETYIICSKEQFKIFKQVLRESVFGPEAVDLRQDYALDKIDADDVPDLSSELAYFAGSIRLPDMVKFGIFKNNRFKFKGMTITMSEEGDFSLSYKNKKIADVPGDITYKPTYDIGERLPEPYKPPLFGVTCLGPSHGFDPEQNTSGFIIWLNHSGIMIDPPVNSTEWLEDSNVNPKLIDSIILTHCHADHDAGTFQKILEESKVTIYTTQTVIDHFLSKYSAFTQVSDAYLRKLFRYRRVKIGAPVYINGGRFDFFYTLHSLPTVGFKMSFQDQSFVYSSDHNNDPEVRDKLYNEGIISDRRYEELKNFPWESRVIYHEAGIKPLHTPVDVLNSLPAEIQKKTVVYHIADKDFPAETDLTMAKFGIENTLVFETESPDFEKAEQVLSLLRHLDFYEDMPVSKAAEFLTIVEEEHFKKDDYLIRQGTKGDKFFILYSGNVSIRSEGLETRKLYGAYDYFGEVALMTEQTRVADVVAETDIVAYSITRDKFLNFIAGTEFEKTLKRLISIRDSETWNVLSNSKLLQAMTSTQKTWLESILEPVEVKDSGNLIRENFEIPALYIIRKGSVEVSRRGDIVASLSRGDLVGSVIKVHRSETADYTYANIGPVSLYRISKKSIIPFLEKNPGLIMKLIYPFQTR